MDTYCFWHFCCNGSVSKYFIVHCTAIGLETVDLTANGVYYIIYLWAARQFALGFIFAFATFKKSIPMLTIAYVFFLVMFVGDFFIGILQKENSMIISAVIMCLIASTKLYFINRKK